MCVIMILPKGIETPNEKVLRAMHRANPHGCGFCTPTMSYKGLDFEKFLFAMTIRDKSEPCMVHFRYATHGSVKDDNCHPFYDKDTNTFFMHNGILDITPRDDMTDSETAFRDLFVPKIKRYGIQSKAFTTAAENVIGWSKFAFLQDDRLRLMGQYFEVQGTYFSNLRFADDIS